MTYQRDILISSVLAILVILAWAWSAPSAANEPPSLTGTVGCVVTWAYPPAEQDKVLGFPFVVDGQWRKRAPADARSIPCDEIGLSSPGNYRLEVFARSKDEAVASNSPRVVRSITIMPGKAHPAAPPSEIRLSTPK